MTYLEAWLLNTSVGRNLLCQEADFLKSILVRINGGVLLQFGLVNLLDLGQDAQFNDYYKLGTEGKVDIVTDLECLAIATESIDAVILIHVAELKAKVDLLLQEIARILKPNGKLIILNFNPHCLWQITPKWQGHKIIKKRKILTLKSLSLKLNQLSLRVVQGKYIAYIPLIENKLFLQQADLFEKAGNRWWPHLSGVYAIMAEKQMGKLILQKSSIESFDISDELLVPLTSVSKK